ncbi:hypothetical protein GUITHDRAFT_117779 [Guillardia theta CCMP2712]|uniref:Uncharacterized protein n=1 Tax=Guillardia theta (strain CCMP2712) TaxID=905079 RepID=L1IJK2_GUITC|nr:hypothetical protein GUITHDRAFT_117779 [Guillardia theta CCMP2712]EKX36109.1 hypothetical protein GUITHDRAFT_117779 [Guillardia theta CCMP2712]|eukprot:XP_005823089.1 hypothetical protein GUITHDRAFT_117779 [Guillardia theta CCMP2712]
MLSWDILLPVIASIAGCANPASEWSWGRASYSMLNSVLGKRRNMQHATEIIDLDGPSHREARDPFPERRVVHVDMNKEAKEEARTKSADKEKKEPKGRKSSLRSKEEAGGASRVQQNEAGELQLYV